MNPQKPICGRPTKYVVSEETIRPKETLLYFAYDVNMLSTRMECCVDKGIAKKGIAKLDCYKLRFGSYSEEWGGCLPTVVKTHCPESSVWGILWEMDKGLKPRLDTLQGVDAGIYEDVEMLVTPFKAKGATLRVLTYQLQKRPRSPLLRQGLPVMKARPSKLYMEEMIYGAEEAGIPAYYLKWLKTVPHNGYG